jgi:YD repeat-containing protein
MTWSFLDRDRRNGLLAAVVVLVALPASSRAADVESREFRVLVDNKLAGKAVMGFNRADDGTTTVSCDTKVEVKILFVKYVYTYRGQEVWKDGRLVSFGSSCNDDGKQFQVTAAAQNQNVLLRTVTLADGKTEERMVPADVWLSSYWSQPANAVINKTIPIFDADNGKDISARVIYVGGENHNRFGQVQHFRLEGKNNVDLWYDATGRLVRQDFLEQGHRTVLELAELRR